MTESDKAVIAQALAFVERVTAWKERGPDRHDTLIALRSAIAQPEQTHDKLLTIIAHAYQIAGACDVPAHILDVLAHPEQATQGQIDAMLPFVWTEQPEQTPPVRQPLTIQELTNLAIEDEFILFCDIDEFIDISRAIEAAHGIVQTKYI